MNELKEKDILKKDLNDLYNEYPTKLKADYSFDNFDFTKLSKDDAYLITVNLDNSDSMEYITDLCKSLIRILNDKGITDVIIVPLRNGTPLVNIYKKGE